MAGRSVCHSSTDDKEFHVHFAVAGRSQSGPDLARPHAVLLETLPQPVLITPAGINLPETLSGWP
jgi:hypothetical protein